MYSVDQYHYVGRARTGPGQVWCTNAPGLENLCTGPVRDPLGSGPLIGIVRGIPKCFWGQVVSGKEWFFSLTAFGGKAKQTFFSETTVWFVGLGTVGRPKKHVAPKTLRDPFEVRGPFGSGPLTGIGSHCIAPLCRDREGGGAQTTRPLLRGSRPPANCFVLVGQMGSGQTLGRIQ